MTPPGSPEEAAALLDGLRSAGTELASRPIRELIRVLGSAGNRFLDPEDPLRQKAEAALPEEAGLSPPMVRAVVEGMARDWTAPRLEALVEADFRDPGVLDGFRPGPRGELLRAMGGTLAFHIGAGSVPGVGAMSLLRSLLVKCPVLLKPGRGDVTLPTLLARAIAESDPGLARALAVVYWPGEDGGTLEDLALREASRVVVYGGTETVRALRSRIPATTPLVAYHHRWSMGAVARERLTAAVSARRTATDAAMAVAVFDQRGCVSPQVIWVEEGGEIDPLGWARLLAKELEALEASLPPGPVDAGTAAAVHQLRGTSEIRGIAGSGEEVLAGKGVSWTVLYEPDPKPLPSCLSRTVRVKPVEALERIPELLVPFAPVLQTLAVEATRTRREALAEGLARSGITRITTFRDQPWPPAWWRHDGTGPLQALVRWISLEGQSEVD